MLAAIADTMKLRGQRPSATAPFAFKVDGTSIQAEAHGQRARLTCILADAMPAEDMLRMLMGAYLRYADHGAEILCSDNGGRLLLVAELDADDDPAARTREFCDAAVHWTRVAGRLTAAPQGFAPMPVAMIFP